MVATLLLVPPMIRFAHATGTVDVPNERKVHLGSVPRTGGLAMFFGCMVTFLIYPVGFEEYRGIFLGILLVVITGLIDDTIGLEPRLKFLGQLVAALAAMAMSDVNINFLGGLAGTHFSLGFLSWPLTILWIVGVTNAINLSDGLDGLAGGVSLIAFSCFGYLAYQNNDPVIFSMCLVLMGSIFAFLRYNTHPAVVFMGDTGSLFLGYCLATFSIAGDFKSLTAMTLVAPVVVLLVPIADTLWAILRRIREGRSPFSADKKHFHHQLLSTGMNQTQTVAVIYTVSALLSGIALLLVRTDSVRLALVPVLLVSLVLIVAQGLGFFNMIEWANRVAQGFARQIARYQARDVLTQLMLRCVQLGTLIYIAAFLYGLLQLNSALVVFIAAVVALLTITAISGARNNYPHTIYSLFFLAAVAVLVVNHHLQSSSADQTFLWMESIGFVALTMGLFAKIVFKRTDESFLSTPLEFFIFLVLVTIAIVPRPMREEYHLVQITMRTFFLFLSLKLILLTGTVAVAREQGADTEHQTLS